jgi:hypothetical protein
MANIQDIRATDNPQRNYEFEVEIVGSVAGGNLPILTQRVQNATLPETAVETIEINYKSRKTFHAGRDASGHTFTVTFWEDEDNSIYQFFKNWMENGISNSQTGAGQTRDQYAAEMLVKRFAADSNTITQQSRITKVFPTNIGDIQLAYEGSEVSVVEVTFSFDSNNLE